MTTLAGPTACLLWNVSPALIYYYSSPSSTTIDVTHSDNAGCGCGGYLVPRVNDGIIVCVIGYLNHVYTQGYSAAQIQSVSGHELGISRSCAHTFESDL